jgi:hypothetical protein
MTSPGLRSEANRGVGLLDAQELKRRAQVAFKNANHD